MVTEYRLTNTIGTKVNRYRLYVNLVTEAPVYYEMYGYDSLLGSHFDIYKIEYSDYQTSFGDDVFDTPLAGIHS